MSIYLSNQFNQSINQSIYLSISMRIIINVYIYIYISLSISLCMYRYTHTHVQSEGLGRPSTGVLLIPASSSASALAFHLSTWWEPPMITFFLPIIFARGKFSSKPELCSGVWFQLQSFERVNPTVFKTPKSSWNWNIDWVLDSQFMENDRIPMNTPFLNHV